MSETNCRAGLWNSFGLTLAEGVARGKPEDVADEEVDVGSFADFIPKANPAFTWYAHNYTIAEVAQKIADGELKRVMIWVPPGTGKSETVTRLLSAYYLHRFPARTVGLVSYGADLAEDLAGDARDYYVESGGELDDSTEAKKHWKTKRGGGMWARGFAGAIRGKRFHLGIIDDPHKGPEDLESEALKGKFQRWWARTWLNRQNVFFEKGAAIVVVMQRLDENDLCGWLLQQPNADQWVVVALDAVKQEEPFDVPKGVTLWPDKRKVGQNLCPEILTASYLEEQKLDEDTYNAQFLQRPKPQAGAVFQESWFKIIGPEMVPPPLIRVMGVDVALKTSNKNDFTCAMPCQYSANGNFYFFWPALRKVEAPDGIGLISRRAKESKVSIIGVESVAFQASVPQYLRRDGSLAGVSIIELETTKDKVVSARTWSPLAEQGLIYLVDDGSGWVEKFLKEACRFPRGKHDDQVDAAGKCIEIIRSKIGHLTTPGAVAGGKAVVRPIIR